MLDTETCDFFSPSSIDRIIGNGGGLPGPSQWDKRSAEERREDLAEELDFIASDLVNSKVAEFRANAELRAAPKGRGRPRDIACERFVEQLQSTWLVVWEGRFGVSRTFNRETGIQEPGGPLIRFLLSCHEELAERLKAGPEIFHAEHREAVRSELRTVTGNGLINRVQRGPLRSQIRQREADVKRQRTQGRKK